MEDAATSCKTYHVMITISSMKYGDLGEQQCEVCLESPKHFVMFDLHWFQLKDAQILRHEETMDGRYHHTFCITITSRPTAAPEAYVHSRQVYFRRTYLPSERLCKYELIVPFESCSDRASLFDVPKLHSGTAVPRIQFEATPAVGMCRMQLVCVFVLCYSLMLCQRTSAVFAGAAKSRHATSAGFVRLPM